MAKRKQNASRIPDQLSEAEETFAHAVAAKGYSAATAYRLIVPETTMKVSWEMGSKWMGKEKIKKRIEILRRTFEQIVAEEFAYTKAVHLKHLLDIAYTPVGETSEMDPHVQAVRRRHGKTGRGTPGKRGEGDSEEGGYEIEEIELPNKLAAMDQAAKILQFYPKDKAEGEALAASAEAVAALRRLLEGEQEKPAG